MKLIDRNALRNTFLLVLSILLSSISLDAQEKTHRTVIADVVVLEQPIIYNRLGSLQPNGLMYALKRDVVAIDPGKPVGAGNAMLRPDKRPRPMVLRANEGDHLTIHLTNYITPLKGKESLPQIGFSVSGMEFLKGVQDDGAWVGANGNHQVAPNTTKTFHLLAKKEGSFIIQDPTTDNAGIGLFGSLTVQPPGAEWYRSQVNNKDLTLATNYWMGEDGTKITKDDAKEKGLLKDGQVSETIGYPVLNYQAKYPEGHPNAGQYVLKMLDDKGNILYTDLTALITGPNNGDFVGDDDNPVFQEVPASPNRRRPYREICIHYHNIFSTTQAFADSLGAPAYLTGGEAFALNYGSDGIQNEIYANRVKVGPMADCVDCKYEEFFLSSWSVGDPGMVVDVDATTSLQTKGKPKATLAKYADDPSNVYHAYLWDHTKFRINHTSRAVTHVHHQHAHQWLHSPNDPDGHYMDSQTINPGASWTLEFVYNGAGNKNLSPGDHIFHCHFYPHFAAGMWALWRVHDVLELGTQNKDCKPIKGSRALPDGEIAAGTPIPAIVPIPTQAMPAVPAEVSIDDGQAVMPEANKNPGFPFFIPGIAGSRPPHPPMDFAVTETGETLDGGMPRHLIKTGKVVWNQMTPTDWTKLTDNYTAIQLPEEGTPVERAAMDYHAQHHHDTYLPTGTKGEFRTNGRLPVKGAPYADPAVNLDGEAEGSKRIYKAANIQLDVVFNKKGWHYPQQRMISLWDDVKSTLSGKRPPEPFFFRANTYNFIEFWHTNLIPAYYELDDFQVRTPTDVLGQHIHLVKFDVTSSDGAANGFNYEDGTFSPDEVRDRIDGINEGGTFLKYAFDPNSSIKASKLPVNTMKLQAKAPMPVWGTAPANQNWEGAQTTVQRWYADPLFSSNGTDRTIRTVFTHDHFSPSTHQQIGLYAGLLVEPANSKWFDAEKKDTELGTRDDGGPTSFQAIIKTEDKADSYREFALEFQDLAFAYTADSKGLLDPYPIYPGDTTQAFLDSVAAYTGWADPKHAVAPNVASGKITPQLISQGAPLTYAVNYRSESLPLRLAETTPDAEGNYQQAAGSAGDLSYSFSSLTNRADPVFNKQPKLNSPISGDDGFRFPQKALTPGMQPGDPYTPLLRAYENDKVQIRTLVGAHEFPHIFNIQGLPWLFEPSAENSGYRSTQMMSISEHFEMNFQMPGKTSGTKGVTDYLYNTSADNTGLNAGVWGLIRAYPKETSQEGLQYMPNNEKTTPTEKNCGCPDHAPLRTFDVGAYLVAQLKEDGNLYYNDRENIFDPASFIFVKESEVYKGEKQAMPARSNHMEPMVLRANAGDCIKVNLTNNINTNDPAFKQLVTIGFNNPEAENNGFNVQVTASGEVGLHPQLLSFAANQSGGSNIGLNDPQTAKPNKGKATYEWYAGRWEGNKPKAMEYGTVLLTSSDPMEQYARGLFGAVIIEPLGATWREDEFTATTATVFTAFEAPFREFVLFHQDNVALQTELKGKNVGAFVKYGVNYRSEPFSYRYYSNEDAIAYAKKNGSLPLPSQTETLATTTYSDPSCASTTVTPINNFSLLQEVNANSLVKDDPETPIFSAGKGMPVRIRLIKPGGAGNPETFLLDGHNWQEEPYKDKSSILGYNANSQWLGSRPQLAALNNFDLLIDHAGGEKAKTGDYIYRIFQDSPFRGGAWGLVRVTNGEETVVLNRMEINDEAKELTLYVSTTVDVRTGKFPETLELCGRKARRVAGENKGYAGNGTEDWVFENLPFSILEGRKITIMSDKKKVLEATEADLVKLISNKPLRPIVTQRDLELERLRKKEESTKPSREVEMEK